MQMSVNVHTGQSEGHETQRLASPSGHHMTSPWDQLDANEMPLSLPQMDQQMPMYQPVMYQQQVFYQQPGRTYQYAQQQQQYAMAPGTEQYQEQTTVGQPYIADPEIYGANSRFQSPLFETQSAQSGYYSAYQFANATTT